MAQRPGGNRGSLSYLGVSAVTPPDVIIVDRDPDQDDLQFQVGTLWLRKGTTRRCFQLMDKDDRNAFWAQLYPVGGSPGAQTFFTDNGTAGVNSGDITITAGVGLQTRASANNTVMIEPNQPNLGYIFMSSAGFAEVRSPNGSIAVNFTQTGLELEVAAGFSGGTDNFATDAGDAQPTAGGEITIAGGANINTAATGNNEITVRTNDAIFLAGTAGGSSTGQSAGVYGIGNAPVMHTYGDETNFFAGVDAGNFTMSSSINNVGVGAAALGFITNNANGNVGIGSGSLENLEEGDGNIAIGNFAGTSYNTDESENILLRSTGSTGENNTIRIGDPNTHNQTFIAGAHGVTPSGSDIQQVTIDSDGQLGSTTSGTVSNVVSSIETDTGGPVTPNASNEINILGGSNINTEGNNNEVTVNLNESVYLPATSGSNTGVYGINSERVLHSFGSNSNIFVGRLSGNFSFTLCRRNTGVGFRALEGLANGASDNVGIGLSALRSLPNGSLNTAIGQRAGVNYTTNESNNILLFNEGVAGDNYTIRIGNVDTHARAFMAGVYNVSPPGSDVETVVMDSNGQIGTTSSTGGGGGNTVAFFGYVSTPTRLSGVQGFEYDLGSNGEITERYDIGNNFDPATGDASPSQFTVPTDGRYHFSAAGSIAGNTDVQPLTIIFRVNGTNAIGTRVNANPTGGTALGSTAGCVSGTLNLSAGDVVTCRFTFFGEDPNIQHGATSSWWTGFQVG